MFCFASIHNCIFLFFRKITHIRGPVWFKRMPESTGSGNYYHRGVYISRYLIAAFSKLFNYKIFGHNSQFLANYFVHFLSFFSFFFLLIFYFYLFFLAFLLSFISFTHTQRIYVHTYMRIMHETHKNTKEPKYKLRFIST